MDHMETQFKKEEIEIIENNKMYMKEIFDAMHKVSKFGTTLYQIIIYI